jgi:hypothetical protein
MTARAPEIRLAGAPAPEGGWRFTLDARCLEARSDAPPGFSTGPAFSVREGRVEWALAGLRPDGVDLDAIRLEAVTLGIERAGGTTNYEAVLRARAAAARGASGGPGFRVRDLVVRDAVVRARQGLGALGAVPITLRAPEVRLRGVGEASERGVIARELHDVVVRAILEAVLGTDVRTIPQDLARDVKAILADLAGTDGAAAAAAKGDGPVRKPGKEAGVGAGLRELGGEAVKTLKEALKD